MHIILDLTQSLQSNEIMSLTELFQSFSLWNSDQIKLITALICSAPCPTVLEIAPFLNKSAVESSHKNGPLPLTDRLRLLFQVLDNTAERRSFKLNQKKKEAVAHISKTLDFFYRIESFYPNKTLTKKKHFTWSLIFPEFQESLQTHALYSS